MKLLISIITVIVFISCNQSSNYEPSAPLSDTALAFNPDSSRLLDSPVQNKVPKKKRKKGKTDNTAYLIGSDTLVNHPAPLPPIKKKRVTNIHANSGQCLATTKKGYRCSRKARSGGYCWQHGG